LIDAIIQLVGTYGLCGTLLLVGYLLYDKNSTLGVILILAGLILSIYVVVSEIEFKRKRHEAPWLFERW